ncbi:Polyamine transporter 4 [Alternaria gaisen]|uniref:Polyamine transporter 4 n=1 Tax=Alternaria gaisen TaxID=167740 RepID=A0ACB6FGV9_9PLEO|nr:Polyamine transporter 4 [Alternaria gaisen]
MSSRHHQNGHATFIHDPENALDEKQEDSDFEHQPPGQTANISEEQRASDRVADKDKSSTLPVSSLDWNGPDDPDNPHNWSIWKAAYHTTIPAVFGFAVTFGTSVYSPAIADVMRDFQVSRTAALVGVTLYTLGLAFGPIFTAPFSERQGRKPVYLFFFPIFMLFTLGAGFSKSYASLIICRFFAGLAGSPGLAVGAGTNADLYPPHKRALTTSLFLMAPFAGPSIGPVVGGFVAQYKTWKWTQWCILFLALFVYIIALPMSETYKPMILKKRAKKQGIVTKQETADLTSEIVMRFIRPLHLISTEPVVFFFSLYTGFAFAVLFLFFAAFPYVFTRPPYSFTPSQSGLVFIPILIGVILGGTTTIIVDRTLYQKKYRETVSNGKSHVDPEHRLYSAMGGAWGMVIGLFWFGWCADQGVHWAPTIIGVIPFAWGNLCVFTSSALYLSDVYGAMNGASAIAANGIVRYILGAVFPLFTVQMYEALGIGWATSLLGFLSLGMVPIPFLFFKYGPAIRAKSRYPVAI